MGTGQHTNIKKLEAAESNRQRWFWRVQDFSDRTADVVETARWVELEVKPRDVTQLLKPHDKDFSGVVAYGGANKKVSSDGTYFWWNDDKGLRIGHKFSW